MKKIIAKLSLKEAVTKDLMNLFEEMIDLTRKEEGCIKYELFQDVNNPKVVSFIEEWDSTEHLNSHMKSEHFQRIMPLLGSYLEKDVEINVYTVLL